MDVFRKLALLTDERAKAVARVAAEDLLAGGRVTTETSPELRAALQNKFDVGTVPAGSSDEAVLARHVLVFLAESDPDFVERCLQAASTESVLGVIAMVTVGLVILQTKIKLKRSTNGKWSIEVEKASASDGLLKNYIKSMLGLWK